MKKEILNEINRFREIIGLNLLSEATGGPGIPLINIGPGARALATLSDEIETLLQNSDNLLNVSGELLTKYPFLTDLQNQVIALDYSQNYQQGGALEKDPQARDMLESFIIDDLFKSENLYSDFRITFAEKYLDEIQKGKFINRPKLEKQFKEAADSGLSSVKKLPNKIIDEINNVADTQIPRWIKDIAIAEVNSVAAEQLSKPNTKKGTVTYNALNKSYNDFMNLMAVECGVKSTDDLKKFITKNEVNQFKEALVRNDGDINATLNQYRKRIQDYQRKIEAKQGPQEDFFGKIVRIGGEKLESILSVGPLKGAFEKIKAGESLGKATLTYAVVAVLIILASSAAIWWKELGEEVLPLNELSAEEKDLEKKFSNINKTNNFWKQVYAIMKATGKIGELMSGSAAAFEEYDVETAFFGEDTNKVTFNWKTDLGQMVWYTDNEGEEVSYGSGTGIFPADKFDKEYLENSSEKTKSDTQKMNPPTDKEFKDWFASEYSQYTNRVTEVNNSTPTINNNDVTVDLGGGAIATFTKTADGKFVVKNN